ncbi:MAG: proline dehydrogenase, partial [Proteobacteria bacterium]|nr:proline dehydrogenase [Pseudomonadota bacterium]
MSKPSKHQATVDLNNTKIAFSALSNYQLEQAKLLFRIIGQPTVVKLGPRLAEISLKLRLPIKSLIKKTIFSHFCGGET